MDSKYSDDIRTQAYFAMLRCPDKMDIDTINSILKYSYSADSAGDLIMNKSLSATNRPIQFSIYYYLLCSDYARDPAYKSCPAIHQPDERVIEGYVEKRDSSH